MGTIIEKCEHCNAKLEYEEGANEVVCEYCGNKKVINNNSNIINPIPNTTPVNLFPNNGYKQPVTTIPKKNKKHKKNMKKKLLSFFFILVIIASGIIYYIDSQKKEKEPEIFEQLPSEIVVDEKDKTGFTLEGKEINLAPDVDFNQERAKYKNNDIVGRLEIPDLFNVLVVKGKDNSYYLSHSLEKKSDVRGTEFIDYRNTVTSKQLNVYGHNTRDSRIKVAFLKLEQFLKEEFFNNNPYIVFQHDGGKNFYKIISIKEIKDTNNEHMYLDYTGSAFVNHVKNMTTGEGVYNARNVSYDENSEIIVLQTCSHHWKNAFYIITAVKMKI